MQPAGGETKEVLALISLLHETEQRLQHLVGGGIDAVINPNGESHLLLHAQERLRQSEERFRSVFSAAAIGMAVSTPDGFFTKANPAYCRMLGYAESELKGLNFASLTVPEDLPLNLKLRDALLAGLQESFVLEKRYLKRDGSIVWTRQSVSATRDSSGAIDTLIVVAEDITTRKQSEDLLAESQQRLFLATNGAHIGIWDWDVAMNVAVWDAKMFELYGIHAADFGGVFESWQKGVHPDDRQRADSEIAAALKGTRDFDSEFRVVWPNGEVHHLEGHAVVLRASDGTANRMIGVNWDITARKTMQAALEESQLRHRLLFDNMMAGYCYCQLLYEDGKAVDYIYLEVNGAFFTQTGLLNVIGRKVSEVVPGMHESNPEQLETYSRVASTGKPERLETYAKLLGIWFSVSIYSHEKEHFIAVFDNITQRKRDESRIRRLVDSNAQGVFFWNTNGEINDANDTFLGTIGYTRDDLESGRISWSSMTPLEYVDRDGIALAEVTANGVCRHYEKEFIRKNGSRVPILIGAATFADAPNEGVCFVVDLTDRKMADETLRESEARFRQLADSIDQMFWLRDPESRKVLYVSPAYERIWGRSCEELIADSSEWQRSIYPADLELAVRNAAKTANGDVCDFEYRIMLPDGGIRWVRDRGFPVRNANGVVQRIAGLVEDITEKRLMETHMLRAQRMEGIGTLAGGIAHDLNNVLTPILMSVQLLRAGLPPEKAKAMLDTLESSAQRGAGMVKQVLMFARGADGEKTQIDPRQLISETKRIISETFPRSIVIETKVAPDCRYVVGDLTQLHQVLLNLCVNSRDAMPQGGTLKINASNVTVDAHFSQMNPGTAPGDYVVIQVTDSGTGIPQDIINKIFDPFFTTKEVGKGTGLGLSTLQAIIKGHSGLVRVYSEPSRGTKFNVFLPSVSGPSADLPAVLAPVDMPRGNGELLLVADDELPILLVAKGTLEAFGYRVLLAQNGAEALALFAKHSEDIALVLTDMMMPIVDGPSVIAAINHIRSGTIFVASSGLTSMRELSKGVPAIVKYHLQKPYTADKLLMTIRTALDA